MSNGDNWQGDVLRDLKASPPPQPPQAPATPEPPPAAPASAPGPGGPTGRPGTVAPSPVTPAPGAAAPERDTGAVAPQPPDPRGGYARQQHVPQAQPVPLADPPTAPGSGSGAPAPSTTGTLANTPDSPAQHAAPGGGGYAMELRVQANHTSDSQPAPGSRHTPDSRPVVDEELTGVERKSQRGESAVARGVRAVRRTVSASAAKEVAETTRTAESLQQPVTTGRQIAVTSIRGGSGKSTVTALLGMTYAHYRKDPVLVVEADPALGSLPLRLGVQSLRWTTGDIANIVQPQMSLLDVTGYLVQLPGNAWLLPGSQGQIGAMLDTASYGRAMVALRRYFGVTVVDCETLPAEVARVALSAAQARVLTAPATLEGVTSTRAVLQWMRELPRQVIAGTVVVLTELAPHPGLDLDAAVKKLTATGASVHVLPYDRHLAAGGMIRTELLAHPTREAVTRFAADAFQLSQRHH
ncbi:MinD/ParA family ATP-binding protein [Streptomyces bluensis]|uniref:MinD/ParA family ATP-binding protein n=1 Tax=Streptomyces bluensis TaxID=33897 RepID=UPI00331E82F5